MLCAKPGFIEFARACLRFFAELTPFIAYSLLRVAEAIQQHAIFFPEGFR